MPAINNKLWKTEHGSRRRSDGRKTTLDRVLQNTTSDYHQRIAYQIGFTLHPRYPVKTGPGCPIRALEFCIDVDGKVVIRCANPARPQAPIRRYLGRAMR